MIGFERRGQSHQPPLRDLGVARYPGFREDRLYAFMKSIREMTIATGAFRSQMKAPLGAS
jgi:hypothetical protein